MRIVVASSTRGVNGSVVYARRIIPLLAARGHEVWLAARPGSWIARQTAGQVPVVATEFRRWPFGELSRVAEFCGRERIDLVHSHSTRAASFGSLLKAMHGIPSVAHLHADAFQVHAWFQSLVIAVSRHTLACHRSRLAGLGGRGAVLWNFVDPGDWSPKRGRDLLRELLGVGEETPVVLVAGLLCRRKGQDLAVRSLELIRRSHPRATLAIVGRGPLRRRLHGEGVHLLGHRDDLPELLPHATVVLVPSRREPFSLVALEAMACGVPVIAADAGGVAELMAEAGGRLVPVGDARALAAEAASLIGDPQARREQSALGLRAVHERFLPGPHVEALERLYARVVQKPAGRRETV